jgi:hypothetical protein
VDDHVEEDLATVVEVRHEVVDEVAHCDHTQVVAEFEIAEEVAEDHTVVAAAGMLVERN